MTFVKDALAAKDPKSLTFSYEYFPPKTEVGIANLTRRIGSMLVDKPLFMDVTWGAGGSTSTNTIAICKSILDQGGNPSMHLTCTNMKKELIDEALDLCKQHGFRNIVALRGDPPAGEEKWAASDLAFTCALDLIKYIRANHGDYFDIVCAGYPEAHPSVIDDESGVASPDAWAGDLAYLKEKVEAGCSAIITQLFFDVSVFMKWAKACKDAGINVPLIPGIMPITTYAGFKRMTTLCKTFIPKELQEALDAAQEDSAAVAEIGHAHVVKMCKELADAGYNHLHFYTLNAEGPTWKILKDLGCNVGTVPVPKAPAAAAPAVSGEASGVGKGTTAAADAERGTSAVQPAIEANATSPQGAEASGVMPAQPSPAVTRQA